ncbi:MAG: HAD family phosphatase [Clostridiales bacterium]|nr:HAD family phosphatase [Clostridiales bacterium]
MKMPYTDDIKKHARCLIFDLDGTVLDSMDLWNRVDIQFLSKRGFEVTDDYTEVVKSVNIDDAAVYTKERFSLPETPQEIMDEWNSMVSHAYAHEVKLKDGVSGYLKRAKEEGFILAFATALSRSHAHNALRSNGVLDLFTCGLTLEDIGKKADKTDPGIYLAVSDITGIPPSETIVFEDVPVAIEGAEKGGFQTCAVYDRIGSGTEEGWKSMAQRAGYYVKNWTDLI